MENLRKLRGTRTQAEVAEMAGIPLRSYQNVEINGAIPQGPNLTAIAKALGVPETRLFLDDSLIDRGPGIPRDLLARLAEATDDEIEALRRVLSDITKR